MLKEFIMSNINSLLWFRYFRTISIIIFFICFFSFFSFFFYLIGVHYPFEQGSSGWTKGEKIAFITLFVLGGVFFFATYYFCSKLKNFGSGYVEPQLFELNEII